MVIKHNKSSSPRVEDRGYTQNGRCLISVRDNGPGISDSVRQSLFEPFVTAKPKGQGLGLAIVAKIVSDHGGTIECESEPRRTVFRARLPMYRPDQEKKP